MSRIARVVVPGLPYHVTHRGNRRSAIFFSQQNREIYLGLLEQHTKKGGAGDLGLLPHDQSRPPDRCS